MARHSTGLRAWTLVAALAVSGAGCNYDEGLIIKNMRGRVFIPVEAATRVIVQPDGTEVPVDADPRLIGPVYLGLYPSVFPENVVERYPHPEVGPQFQEGVPGNTYPYGGTSVGDFRFPCMQSLVCKVTSGRFVDYQDIVDWFALLDQPITDAAGAEVENGDFVAQACYDLLDVTSDAEVRVTAYEDRDGSGAIDAGDLDFVPADEAGYMVADFTIFQQEFFWDVNQEKDEGCTPGVDCRGFSLWGWMDAPSEASYTFSSCDPESGFENREYNADFQGGSTYPDLLNFPASYISTGDYVATLPFQWDDIYDEPDIYLDFLVQ